MRPVLAAALLGACLGLLACSLRLGYEGSGDAGADADVDSDSDADGEFDGTVDPPDGDLEDDSCVPDCSGRLCGPDPVCRRSCGECGEHDECTAEGACRCPPDCAGRECGPDPVCGVSCGACEGAEECNAAGGCNCVPDCAGRACGPDPVCGVSCGGCAAGETCTGAGTCLCVPDCAGRTCGPDPVCGVSCGACEGGEGCDRASGGCTAACAFDAGWGTSCDGSRCGDGSSCIEVRGLSAFGRICAPTCYTSWDCSNVAPGAESCVLGTWPMYCAVRCAADSDCPCELTCRATGSTRICYP